MLTRAAVPGMTARGTGTVVSVAGPELGDVVSALAGPADRQRER